MKKLGLLYSLLITAVLPGCRSMPLVSTPTAPNVPGNDHAVLSVDNDLDIAMIDGRMTLTAGGSNGPGTSQPPMMLLTSGEHVVEVRYVKQSINYSYWDKITTITTETTNFVTLSGNFLGGHFYRVYPRVEGKKIYIEIVDETNPNLGDPGGAEKAGEKRVVTAAVKTAIKQVTTEHREVGMQKLISAALKDLPLASSIVYSGQYGLIELDGHTVTLVFAQNSGDGSDWITNPAISLIRVVYNYSFDTNGNLLSIYQDQLPIIRTKKE